METTVKNHISPSQIGMYLKCPRQWHYRYIEGLKIPPAGALVLGTNFHRAIEYSYNYKIERQEDAPVDEVLDFFAESYDRTFETEEVELRPDEDRGALKDQGIAITRIHRLEIQPSVWPQLIEHPLELDLGDEYPFTLLGILDLIEKDGTLVDNKSWGKTKSQDDLDADLQLSCYSLLNRMCREETEPGIRIDAVIKTKVPKAKQFHTTRSEADLIWLLDLIKRVSLAIGFDIDFPNPNGWWCSEKWCGYWDKCKETRGRRLFT